tara:strand:+ start:301 stop:924 length:624 start_codon:yes stop_codon:yes gene_type:complete
MILSAERVKASERKCIATGQVLSKNQLVRFVLGPNSVIYPDTENKLPGRGIWVKADRSAIMQAQKGQLFSRAAKQSTECIENLAEQVENLVANRIIKLIGLSRKSGQCVCGYEKVKDWLKKDIAKVLIQSSDGSNREKSRLRTPADGQFIGWLSSKELGKVFGRENITHCALASGGLTQRIVEDAQRLKGLRIVKDQNSCRKDESAK